MADFCSLCGYGDIHIEKIYNKHIKNEESIEAIKRLNDGDMMRMNGLGVCEHCGLISFGVNNKFEVIAIYFEDENLKIGEVNSDTFELTIYDDLERYAEQQLKMKLEANIMKEYFLRIKTIKSWIDLTDPEMLELYNKWENGENYGEVGLIELLFYQSIKNDYSYHHYNDYDKINLRVGMPTKIKTNE